MLSARPQSVHDTDPVGVGLHVGRLSGMSSGERVTVGVEVDPADSVGMQGGEGSQVVGVRVDDRTGRAVGGGCLEDVAESVGVAPG